MHVNIFYDARASYVNVWAKQLQFILTFMNTWKCEQLMFVILLSFKHVDKSRCICEAVLTAGSVGVQTVCMVSVHIFM